MRQPSRRHRLLPRVLLGMPSQLPGCLFRNCREFLSRGQAVGEEGVPDTVWITPLPLHPPELARRCPNASLLSWPKSAVADPARPPLISPHPYPLSLRPPFQAPVRLLITAFASDGLDSVPPCIRLNIHHLYTTSYSNITCSLLTRLLQQNLRETGVWWPIHIHAMTEGSSRHVLTPVIGGARAVAAYSTVQPLSSPSSPLTVSIPLSLRELQALAS